jgi:hypothetical protein
MQCLQGNPKSLYVIYVYTKGIIPDREILRDYSKNYPCQAATYILWTSCSQLRTRKGLCMVQPALNSHLLTVWPSRDCWHLSWMLGTSRKGFAFVQKGSGCRRVVPWQSHIIDEGRYSRYRNHLRVARCCCGRLGKAVTVVFQDL